MRKNDTPRKFKKSMYETPNSVGWNTFVFLPTGGDLPDVPASLIDDSSFKSGRVKLNPVEFYNG